MADKTQEQLIDELLKEYKGPESFWGETGIFAQLKKKIIERTLNAEMDNHLGYSKHDSKGHNSGNSRNGRGKKTIVVDSGQVEIEPPRDRNSTFEPQLIPKRQKYFEGFEDKILAMYARGMSVRDIQSCLLDMYQVDVSEGLISEAIIRKVVAEQLSKNPNDLRDEDFAKIFELDISHNKVRDIKLLAKFINLRTLNLEFVQYPQKTIPKWMKILAKLGIFDLDKKFSLDLSPIEKLSNLQTLNLIGSHISSLKPLKNLNNLNDINLAITNITNLKPLSGLPKLRSLNLGSTQVSNLEPLQGLINLQSLNLSETQIYKLKPLYSLKNLKTLNIRDCKNIMDEQVEDLQKALPDLTIYR